MKPVSIILSFILGVASLCFVVFIAHPPVVSLDKLKTPAPTEEDLPMPKTGPFGAAEVSETEFDFGSKLAGDSDQHAFTIKNVGKGTLEFKLGESSCQCTVGEISKNGEPLEAKEGRHAPGEQNSLEPGESVQILVKWVMKLKTEKFRQNVPIFTTDPDHRKIELVVVGTVDGAIHIQPDGVWDLGDISSTEPAKAEGIVASRVLDQFTLTVVERESSKVKVSLEPAEGDQLPSESAKSGYKVKVEVGNDVPIGVLRESIKLKYTAGDREDFVEFSVKAQRFGPIEFRGALGAVLNVNSNRLIFKDFAASTGAKATLTLFVKGMDEKLTVQMADPNETRVKATLADSGQKLGKSKMYRLEVEILPGATSGSHREFNAQILDLKINHPEAPDMRLLLDYNATR